jgi:uncharacterized protein YcaQ
MDSISISEARRIALASQSFSRPRPTRRVTARDVARTIRHIGLLQIDYVNVLIPAQYLVLFSRLGVYDRSLLDEVVYRRREFTEQWAHEASILPIEIWPLLRYRMDEHRVRPYGFEKLMTRHPEYVASVLDAVRTKGPLTAADLASTSLPKPEGLPDRLGEAWFGTGQRAVLEAHFGRGTLAVAERRPNFARAFDLAERILPAEHHGRRIDADESRRELLRLAGAAHGIGTAADLADYYRMPIPQARPRLKELVDSGELHQVRVEGWRDPAYLHRDATIPKKINAAALLSPFDPVVWFRPRATRLFNFDYRIEIYLPESKRVWGYYVLPFLLGDQLVARVDLKADRRQRRLAVMASHIEPGADPGVVSQALATELTTLARWLDLDSVTVERRGKLARPLAAALREQA